MIARSLVGLSLLLGCGSVESGSRPDSGEQVSPDAAPDGGPASTISFRAGDRGTGEDTTSLLLPRPAGVVAGDVLLAQVANRNNNKAIVTPPAGWTEIRQDESAELLQSFLFWKAAGEEPDAYAFDISIMSNAAGVIVAFSGADPANPIDDHDGKANGTSAEFETPPLTTTSSDGGAVWFGAQLWPGDDCPDDPITPPEGFTGIVDECLSSHSTGILLKSATAPLGVAGDHLPWVGSSPYAETNIAQAVALRPLAED